MIHHPSILQNLNKFRVIKMLGFKTKELRGSARSCTELRGVDVEGRAFSFCCVPSSRVAKVNRGPSLMGSTSGNESEIQSLVEKVQKRATEPRRLAQKRAPVLVGPGRRLRGPGEGETSYEASLV